MAYDIFVSYAHLDNEVAEGPAFVTRLVSFIKVEASKKYGSSVSVWWDKDLEAGALWDPALEEQLRDCRILLAIVSPSWVNSKWANKEWDRFWSRVKGDEALGNQTRIIPVSFELSKGFTATLPAQQRSLQFTRHFRSVMSDVEFRTEADGLAADISRLLKKLDELELPGRI
jgi:hypothetical protein